MHATRRGGDIATIQILMTTDQAHRLLAQQPAGEITDLLRSELSKALAMSGPEATSEPRRQGDWYVNGALRLDLREVSAISIVSGLGAAAIVHLRGVAAPLSLPGTPIGVSDLLAAFDRWRGGL